MINNNDKLAQLKKLSAIKADDSWVHATKYDLLSEIDSQNRMMKAQKLSSSEKVDMYVSKFLSGVVPTFNRVIAGFLIVAMGSGFSVAAQASVPGQALWPVKRSIEKAELSLTTNPIKETEIHMKHINKRLDEIEKILKDKDSEPEKVEKKTKAIKQAVSHLEKDVKSADSSLKIVKEEKTPVETVTLAKKVKQKVKETTENLESKAKDIDKDFGEKVVEEVSEINKEVEESVVTLVVEVHEELIKSAAVEESQEEIIEEPQEQARLKKSVVLDPNKVNLEEVKVIEDIAKEMIAEEIEDLEIDINKVKEKVSVVKEKQVPVTEEENAAKSEEEKADDAETKVDLESQEAAVKLVEAKTLLEEGALRDAVEKISEGKEIQKKTAEALQKIENVINEVKDSTSNEEGNDNASSSQDIVNEEVQEKNEEDKVEATAIKEEDIDVEENEL